MNIERLYTLRKISQFINELRASNQPMRNILYNALISSMNEYCTTYVPSVGYNYVMRVSNVGYPAEEGEFNRWLNGFISAITGFHDEYTVGMLNVVLKEV